MNIQDQREPYCDTCNDTRRIQWKGLLSGVKQSSPCPDCRPNEKDKPITKTEAANK